MSTTPEPSATTPKRVAVIAVHGVADQQPGETTTAIANLLGNIDDGDRPAYAPFESESVRIPVRAIEFEDRGTHKHQDWATRARVASRTLLSPLTTRDTVMGDTPACFATSCMVTTLLFLRPVFGGGVFLTNTSSCGWELAAPP